MNIRKLGNPVGRAEYVETYNIDSGPDNVTTTTTSTPPGFLAGPLAAAAGQAQNAFSSSGQVQDPSRFTNPGDRLILEGQGLTSDTLQGNFLSPDSNPFLEGTFNRAADLTRGRLDSEFSGAGRNIGASRPARSEELQTLASNIFGGNFQAERDRQLTAVDQAQGLDPLNMFINRLAGVIPGAGGVTSSTQPTFRTGLF